MQYITKIEGDIACDYCYYFLNKNEVSMACVEIYNKKSSIIFVYLFYCTSLFY